MAGKSKAATTKILEPDATAENVPFAGGESTEGFTDHRNIAGQIAILASAVGGVATALEAAMKALTQVTERLSTLNQMMGV